MKRNMIMIVLDSVNYNILKESKNKDTPTPFLQKLMNENVKIENMYSQTPYTESALVSLHCGINTLNRFGHMKRNKFKNTIFDIYLQNGYEIISNGYQPAIYPSGQMPKYEKRYYNFPYQLSQVWNYRLKYFKEVHQNDTLTKEEITLLIDIMDDNFNEWIKYFEYIQNESDEVHYIIDSIDKTGLEANYKLLKNEYKKYQKSKSNYIFELLDLGEEHNLFKIKEFIPKNRIRDKEFIAKQIKKYKKIINKVFWKNLKCNLLNNRLSFKKISNYIRAKDFDTLIKYVINYGNALIDKDLHTRINKKYDSVKDVPSLNSMLEHSLELIKNRSSNKSFFLYVHADDAHFPETFFSYDTKDEDLLEEEFKLIEEGLKKIKAGFKGSIAYELSLRYIDNCINNYISKLDDMEILNNTDIIITADHGYSYYYNPIRENFVINYYKENYNIPFIIVSPKSKDIKVTNNFYMSKDIVPTMLDISGIEIPNSINGESLLKFQGRDYSLIEFMGGGCPHYYRRPFKLGVRTKKYSLVLEVRLNQKFESYNMVSCYDLVADPLEQNNLIYEGITEDKIKYEINLIKKRFKELNTEINGDGYYEPKK